jgi:hypothetical protein
MVRKLATFVTALLVPGGFIALAGFWAAQAAARTPRGQRLLAQAKSWAH